MWTITVDSADYIIRRDRVGRASFLRAPANRTSLEFKQTRIRKIVTEPIRYRV